MLFISSMTKHYNYDMTTAPGGNEVQFTVNGETFSKIVFDLTTNLIYFID